MTMRERRSLIRAVHLHLPPAQAEKMLLTFLRFMGEGEGRIRKSKLHVRETLRLSAELEKYRRGYFGRTRAAIARDGAERGYDRKQRTKEQ